MDVSIILITASLLVISASAQVADIIKQGNSCKGNNSEAIIQFVLLQDATGSYRGFLTQLLEMMPKFLDTLTKEFPSTQFALASFVDYPNKFNYPSKNAYCYRLFQPFTYEHSQITEGIKRITIENGGYDSPESSLTAILYTATDKQIGWSNSRTRNGKRIYKVIAVTTDEGWKSEEEPGIEEKVPRPPAKGDGQDTCDNFPPSVRLVKEVLEKKDVFLLALIGGNKTELWNDYFTRYGFRKDRSKVVELAPSKAESIANILIEEFSGMITHEQCSFRDVKKIGKPRENMMNLEYSNQTDFE